MEEMYDSKVSIYKRHRRKSIARGIYIIAKFLIYVILGLVYMLLTAYVLDKKLILYVEYITNASALLIWFGFVFIQYTFDPIEILKYMILKK